MGESAPWFALTVSLYIEDAKKQSATAEAVADLWVAHYFRVVNVR